MREKGTSDDMSPDLEGGRRMVAPVDHFGDVVANPLGSARQLGIGTEATELVGLSYELCVAKEIRRKGRKGGREVGMR